LVGGVGVDLVVAAAAPTAHHQGDDDGEHEQ
jgi:hypothetical protein